mgnify:CR=1 FL=1
MKKTPCFIALAFVLSFLIFSMAAEEQRLDGHPSTDTHSDWKLAVQLWTFHKYTFFEALDKASALGVSWIEAYPGQRLGGDYGELVFDHRLDATTRQAIRDVLAERGLRLINYGVVGLSGDEAQNRLIFEFAKDMGVQTIASEPAQEHLDAIEKLCQEYDIRLALHNHPEPSRYWNPETVLEAVHGRSAYIGACADIGHWMRSGVKPVEALQLLKGRIISLHFKDLNEFGNKKAHDVPWGSGAAGMPAIFDELQAQDFKGVFSVEYEHNWESSLPEIRQCIEYFNRQTAKRKEAQWQPLLKNDLGNAIFPQGSWLFEDGELFAKGGGDIWTKDRYGDFILDLEFKLAPQTNSGVFLRTGSLENWLHTAIEVQILDSYGVEKPSKHDCGAIFDCLEPARNAVKPPGQWNRYTITCQANFVDVVLNGVPIIHMNLDEWTEAHKNPDGTPNKFNNAYKDMPREGHIGLQYHGHPVWFRNLRIRKL